MNAPGSLDVHLELDDVTLQRLADIVADRLQSRLTGNVADPWLTAEQAAEYIAARSVHRIYELKAEGAIKFAKDGSRLLFRRSWLDTYLLDAPDAR